MVLQLYKTLIYVVAFFGNEKAKKWISGRNGQTIKDNTLLKKKYFIVWMHCASLGEFEQGRPLLEKIKGLPFKTHIILTFFSPSGYNIRKNYEHANRVYYLPLDHPVKSHQFIQKVQPDIAFFVKYDLWYFYLNELQSRAIPSFLISSIIKNDSLYTKWWGKLHRDMLHTFTCIYTQDQNSLQVLQSKVQYPNAKLAGDTRIDRVLDLPIQVVLPKEVYDFVGKSKKVFVAGSTYNKDEKILFELTQQKEFEDFKLIITPHDVTPYRLNHIKGLWKNSIFLSALENINSSNEINNYDVLILDRVGLLSSVYSLACIVYIGGGFDGGIHNTLEAMVYGVPILFGKNYKYFPEAVYLVETMAGQSIKNESELYNAFLFFQDLKNKQQSKILSKEYLDSNQGAVDTILEDFLLKLPNDPIEGNS